MTFSSSNAAHNCCEQDAKPGSHAMCLAYREAILIKGDFSDLRSGEPVRNCPIRSDSHGEHEWMNIDLYEDPQPTLPFEEVVKDGIVCSKYVFGNGLVLTFFIPRNTQNVKVPICRNCCDLSAMSIEYWQGIALTSTSDMHFWRAPDVQFIKRSVDMLAMSVHFQWLDGYPGNKMLDLPLVNIVDVSDSLKDDDRDIFDSIYGERFRITRTNQEYLFICGCNSQRQMNEEDETSGRETAGEITQPTEDSPETLPKYEDAVDRQRTIIFGQNAKRFLVVRADGPCPTIFCHKCSLPLEWEFWQSIIYLSADAECLSKFKVPKQVMTTLEGGVITLYCYKMGFSAWLRRFLCA